MREDWPIRKLTDIARVQTGKWDANHAKEKGEYRFYTCAFEYHYSDTKRFEGECIILPGNGANVGEVFYYDGEFDAYQRTYVVDQIEEYPMYVYYHLKAFWKQVNINKQYGSATNYLKIGNFHDYKIPIPPLPEQKRIVAMLDEAFEAIDQARANIERNIENAEELFQSKLNEIFSPRGEGWEEKSLKEACEIRPSKRQVKNKMSDDELVSFVPMSHLEINKKHFEEESIKPLGEVYKGYTYFEDGDVLLAKITPCFENGKLGIASNLENGVGFGSSEYIVYRPYEGLLNEYLYYFLNRDSFRKIGESLMGGAVGHQRIQKEFYEDFKITYPDVSKQKEIVQLLDAISFDKNEMLSIYKKKHTALEELKKSILQKAFSGELTGGE